MSFSAVKKVRGKKIIMFVITLLLISSSGWAETYDAEVTTDSGTYSVPVEVEDGEVTYVHWPSGGNMHVYGGDLDDGYASGINSRGDIIQVEINDYEDNED